MDSVARQRLLDEIGERHRTSDLAYLFSGAHIIESCLDRLCLLCPAADAALGALELCPEVMASAFDLGAPVTQANPSGALLRRTMSSQPTPDTEGISNVPTSAQADRSSATIASSSAAAEGGLSSLTPVDGMNVDESRKQAILAKIAERQRRFMRLTSGEDVRPSAEATATASHATSPESIEEEPKDTAAAQDRGDEDALMCTCAVCNMNTCLDPSRADGDEADPNDPLGLVALVQQGDVHLHRPTSVPNALHYELPIASDPPVNHAQADLARLKMDNVNSIVAHQMGQFYGPVCLFVDFLRDHYLLVNKIDLKTYVISELCKTEWLRGRLFSVRYPMLRPLHSRFLFGGLL